MKPRAHYIQLMVLTCLTLCCDFSAQNGKSRVLNNRPVPPFSIPEKRSDIDYIYFAALGDQGMGSDGQRHVANLMNEKAKKDSLHFVITLGDNFYGKGVTSVHDKQWFQKFEAMYDLSHLQTPFYASLGNHDHANGNARHQVVYSSGSDKWEMPYYYYTFIKTIDELSAVQFFALDTDVIVRGSRFDHEQIAWLERELRASNATWKIVYGHHPVFSYGRHGSEPRMNEIVRPLLEKYQVDVYVCGHDHDRQLIGSVGGIDYIVSGTGSKSRNTRYGDKTVFAATDLGFAWFRVSAEELHVQFIDTAGNIEYAHTWIKPDLSGLSKLAVK
ncbi:metallophosphoesterase [bacterium]|nr:metallophosphoesterase [bacterium]